MSGKQSGLVWEIELTDAPGVTRQAKRDVLLAMADHADHEGRHVYPSIGLLSWKTDYSPRQIARIIKELINDKLVSLESENYGKYRSRNYNLHLEKGRKKKGYSGRSSLPKDSKKIEAGQKAKATRMTKNDTLSQGDTMSPMTPDVIPPYDMAMSYKPSGKPSVRTCRVEETGKPFTVSLPDDEDEDGKTPCCGAVINNLKVGHEKTVDDKDSQIARYLRAQAIGFNGFESVRQRDGALSLEKDYEWSLIAKVIDYGLGVKKISTGGIVNYTLGIRKNHEPNKLEDKKYPTQEDYERNLLERANTTG